MRSIFHRNVYSGLLGVLLLGSLQIEQIGSSSSSSDATLKSLTFQRRRRRDTIHEVISSSHPEDRPYIHWRRRSPAKNNIPRDQSTSDTDYDNFAVQMPNGTNWALTGALTGPFVYNPINICPFDERDEFDLDNDKPRVPTGTRTGPLDVGPYLILHPIPNDPGATVRVNGVLTTNCPALSDIDNFLVDDPTRLAAYREDPNSVDLNRCYFDLQWRRRVSMGTWTTETGTPETEWYGSNGYAAYWKGGMCPGGSTTGTLEPTLDCFTAAQMVDPTNWGNCSQAPGSEN